MSAPNAYYDSRFERAVETVLDHEGGFVDHPNDPGGATSFGISLRWLRSIGLLDRDQDGCPDGDLDLDGDVDEADIRRLTRADAKRLYHIYWWERYGYGELQLAVGAKVFDLSVNMGPGSRTKAGAHSILQRACRACGHKLVEDAMIGPKTIEAVNECNGLALLAAIRSEAAGRYRELIAHNSRLKAFERGWLNRAYA